MAAVVEKPKTFEEAVSVILSGLHQVMVQKHRDYGANNINKFGESGVLVRASDKIERLINLSARAGPPSNESIDDSWIDLANYGIIALMLRRGLWNLPMEGDGKR